MSGSLLPNITFSGVDTPIFAYYGTGGGGGSNNGPIIQVSTIFIQDREIWGQSNAPELQWVRNATSEPVSSITLYNATNNPIAQFNQTGFQANNINVNNQLQTPVVNFEDLGQTQIVAQIAADSNAGDALTFAGINNPTVNVSKWDGPSQYIPFAEFNTDTSQMFLHNTADPVSTIYFSASPSGTYIQSLGVSSLMASTITTDTLIATSTFTSTIFNMDYFSSASVFASSIDCKVIDLDNQQLTANATDLLLNGIPIATLSNVSSITDWANYPAVSTIQANSFPIEDAGNINIINNGSYTNTAPTLTFNGDVGSGSQPAVITLTNNVGNGALLISTNQVRINNTSQDNYSIEMNGGIDIYDATNNDRSKPQAQVTLAGDPQGLNLSTIAIAAPQGVYIVETIGNTNVQGTLYTSSIFTSSINGSEFNQNGLVTSTVSAVQISSIIGNVSLQLVSTLQFSPNINPSLGGVNLGLGSILGNVIGWGAGALGAVTGVAALGTGIAALAMGRGNTNVNTNNFEMINGTSQLQVSTIGDYVSSIYRESTGVPADQVPGNEIFVSTIFAPGTTLLRTYSDPMYTVSTPLSTIQAFGPWVEVPGVSPTNSFSTIQLTPSTILRGDLPGATLEVLESAITSNYGQVAAQAYTMAANTSYTTGSGTFYYRNLDNRPGFIDSNATPFALAYTSDFAPLLNTSSITNVSSIAFTGLSQVTLATNATAGGQSQPAGRLVMSGQDLDLGQNDLWCQQVRIGAGNVSGLPSEIIFYSPNNTQRGMNLGNNDVTVRLQSTVNNTAAGYILDTFVNPPFFSTITTSGIPQTTLQAFFPSSTSATVGVSTISVMPQLSYYCSAYSSTTQTVLGANTVTPLNHQATFLNTGGFTVLGSTITVPVSGTYEVGTSIQFDKTGGGTTAVDFWFKKNGVDIPNSGSQTTLQGNTGEVIGTVSIFDTANANDQYAICIASADATMAATFFQSTVTTPYTRPAIPSILTNIKRIGA